MAILVQTALLVAVLAVQYVASFEGDLDMELNLRGDVVDFSLLPLDESCQDRNSEIHKGSVTKCQYWAANRECVLNPKYMQEYCQQSCRVCKCQDTLNCEYWASVGECTQVGFMGEDNIAWMLQKCAKSCGKCQGSSQDCQNLYTDECPGEKASGKCESSILAHLFDMQTSCRKTCDMCGCEDLDKTSDCQTWAKEDLCDKNQYQMLAYCQATCQAEDTDTYTGEACGPVFA